MNHNQMVGPHGSGHIHGQVVGCAAIYQKFSINFHGRKDPGHGHTGPHGLYQRSVIQNHGLSRFYVRGHGAKGNGQLIKIRNPMTAQGKFQKRQINLVAQNGPLGQGNPTLIIEANFKIHQKINIIPLALECKITAVVGLAEQCRPLGCFHQRFQLFRGIP